MSYVKSLFISGGTGSLGSALVADMLGTVDKIVIYSRCEQKQEAMKAKFKDHPSLRFLIGDVRDYDRLKFALRGVDAVIHAAALKIVPKGEYDPEEFVKTNILGSMNMVNACIESGVKKAVLVSTDKCVNPINLYGATKLTAEKLFIAANNLSSAVGYDLSPPLGTMFAAVRYGNVSNSRGSVIPFWKDCMKRGEKLPITHPEMTRFWITLQEATRLVMTAFGAMKGGEIFVPILPAFRVIDLAEAIYPGEENRREIGIRCGEKLHESLISSEDLELTTMENNIYVIRPPWAPSKVKSNVPSSYTSNSASQLSIDDLKKKLDELERGN